MGKTIPIVVFSLLIGVFFIGLPLYAGTQQKILYLNSYHQGYPPSDGMEKGAMSILRGTGHDTKIIRMDSKRNPSEEYKQKAGLQIKKEIAAFGPDVVIMTDDNALKYVFLPYFANTNLPFVFSGVNWSLAQYGGPYRNLTGMIEVALIDQIIKTLKPYARGTNIGFMSGNRYSEKQTARLAQDYFSINFNKKYFVANFAEWQRAWRKAQHEVDILIFENIAGITGWQPKAAAEFIVAHTRIMVGATNDFMTRYALIGITRNAEEQGEYPAKLALEILKGAEVGSFPIVRNKKANIFLNMKLAKKLGIVFPMDLIEDATFVEELGPGSWL